MTTFSEKHNTRSEREPFASPSPTLAPSLRHSTEVQLHSQHKSLGKTIVVDWDPNDPGNPMNWKAGYRRAIGVLIGLSAFCVAFSSSAYAAAIPGIMREFGANLDVALLGLSLFVLGFGLGPLVWGPLSELYGRRTIFIASFIPYTLFHLGAGLSHNITTLLLMRLLGGCFGSSVFSVPAGNLADLFTNEERGPLALLVLAVSPLLGPVCGPLVGGFIAQSEITWRWNFWVMLAFSGVVLILYVLLVPETCHSVILRQRAAKLQHGPNESNALYISKHDTAERKSVLHMLGSTLNRPLAMLAYEPIVLVLSLYTALIYGTLYGFFAAFPIVFQQHRHFNPGETGLAFLGIGLGILVAIIVAPYENQRYLRAAQKAGGHAPPEQRLVGACYAAVLLPLSLIWFSWTTYPSVHWIVPILAGVPFGIGAIIGFTSVVAYMVDSYPMYAASCLAANGILRSVVAFAFPLFIPHLFNIAGDQWGSMFCAFLALIGTPIPFVLIKYGPSIRAKSKMAEELVIQDLPSAMGNAASHPKRAQLFSVPLPLETPSLETYYTAILALARRSKQTGRPGLPEELILLICRLADFCRPDVEYSVEQNRVVDVYCWGNPLPVKTWIRTIPLDHRILRQIHSIRLVAESYHQGKACDLEQDELWGWFEIGVSRLDKTSGQLFLKSQVDGSPAIWMSHTNRVNQTEYELNTGPLYGPDHDIWNYAEEGDVLVVRLNVRSSGWAIHARRGMLRVSTWWQPSVAMLNLAYGS